jgi:PAS domain-containing protein
VGTEQHPVEMIMARGLMANLTTSAFLVDNAGVLVFFNDAAGEILGLRFEEAGPMAPEDWGTRFEPSDLDGATVPVEELPLSIALMQARAAHRALRIRSADGHERVIDVTAFPVVGRTGQSGAIAIFWDDPTA